MRRFFTLYVPPIIGAILIIIKIPDVDTWMKSKFENSSFILGSILVIATLLTHTVTVISPFKKYEKLEKNKWVLLDSITSVYLGQQLFPGYNIVGNIMVPKRVFYCDLEPCVAKAVWGKFICLKGRFGKRLLEPIWLSANHSLNKKFKITTKQGASGRAFTDGIATIVDVSKSIDEIGLNNKQKQAISGNGFVISYPIFEFDEKYSRLGTKIIGAVTLSCNKEGSEQLLSNPSNREKLTETIVDFSRVCSLIL